MVEELEFLIHAQIVQTITDFEDEEGVHIPLIATLSRTITHALLREFDIGVKTGE